MNLTAGRSSIPGEGGEPWGGHLSSSRKAASLKEEHRGGDPALAVRHTLIGAHCMTGGGAAAEFLQGGR